MTSRETELFVFSFPGPLCADGTTGFVSACHTVGLIVPHGAQRTEVKLQEGEPSQAHVVVPTQAGR